MTKEEIKDFCDMKVQLEPENEDIYKAIVKALEQEQGASEIQAIYTEALEEGIRCAMCTNAMKSEKGCDGGCAVDTKMYNKVMTEINSRLLRKIPREGHWMINKEKNLAKCSNCKFFLKDKDEINLLGTFIQGYNYCPYCGADMREGGKEEDENVMD